MPPDQNQKFLHKKVADILEEDSEQSPSHASEDGKDNFSLQDQVIQERSELEEESHSEQQHVVQDSQIFEHLPKRESRTTERLKVSQDPQINLIESRSLKFDENYTYTNFAKT